MACDQATTTQGCFNGFSLGLLLTFTLSSFASINARCPGYELAVAHVNDLHSRFDEISRHAGSCAGYSKCYGGIARLITKVSELRKQHPNFLLLNAGDESPGSRWFSQYEFRPSLHFMARMKYDAMTLGNHEFDLGIKKLVQFIKATKFPVLSANIDASEEPRFDGIFNRSVVLNVRGERIGIVGYTTRDTSHLSTGTGSLKFGDEISAIQQQVKVLKAKGITKVIALGHVGYRKDMEIARQVQGLDLVIGAHSHTFLYSGTPPDIEQPAGPYPTVVWQTLPVGSRRRVPVVQAYAFGKYLGFIKLCFMQGNAVSWSGNPILMDDTNVNNVPPPLVLEVQHWPRVIVKPAAVTISSEGNGLPITVTLVTPDKAGYHQILKSCRLSCHYLTTLCLLLTSNIMIVYFLAPS